MAERFVSCQILTPEGIVFNKDVKVVTAMTDGGEVGILPLHAPYIASLPVGQISVKYNKDSEESFALSGGFIQVIEDKVTVLARSAESTGKIDINRARKAKQEAEEELARLDANDEKYSEAKDKLSRSENRLKLIEKAKK